MHKLQGERNSLSNELGFDDLAEGPAILAVH